MVVLWIFRKWKNNLGMKIPVNFPIPPKQNRSPNKDHVISLTLIGKCMIYCEEVLIDRRCLMEELKVLVRDIALVLKIKFIGLNLKKDIKFLQNPKDGIPSNIM